MKRIRLLFSSLFMMLIFAAVIPLPCCAETFSEEYLEKFRYDLTENDTAIIQGFDGYEANLVIPSKLDGYTVTAIDEEAFRGEGSLITVTIPSTVKTIGYGAFWMCVNLESVSLPGSLVSIDMMAFEECSSLKQISLPASLTNLGPFAFSGCESLTSVTIPPSIKVLRDYTFNECTALQVISIPSSVKTIEAGVFYGCIRLNTVYYGGSLVEWQSISLNKVENECLQRAVVKCAKQSTPKLSSTSLSLYVNNTASLKVVGTLDKVTWSSSKKSVATVSSSGVVTAKKKGTCVITAKFGNRKLTCKVTVKGVRKVKKVTLSKTKITLTVGSSCKLLASVSPTNASKKTVTWSSSKKSVAKVTNGTVKALKAGTATITVKAKDGSGKKATCKVTVKKASSSGTAKTRTCTYCNGTRECPKCNGSGQRWNSFYKKWERCGVCEGWKRCPRCNGTGKIKY